MCDNAEATFDRAERRRRRKVNTGKHGTLQGKITTNIRAVSREYNKILHPAVTESRIQMQKVRIHEKKKSTDMVYVCRLRQYCNRTCNMMAKNRTIPASLCFSPLIQVSISRDVCLSSFFFFIILCSTQPAYQTSNDETKIVSLFC